MDRETADRLQKQRYYESLVEIRNQINNPKTDLYGHKKVFMLAFIDAEIAEKIQEFMIANEISFSQAIEASFLPEVLS